VECQDQIVWTLTKEKKYSYSYNNVEQYLCLKWSFEILLTRNLGFKQKIEESKQKQRKFAKKFENSYQNV